MPTEATAPVRILVVEDDPDLTVLVRTRLASELPGVSVITHAETLAGAMARLTSASDVDLVILDLGLPDAPADPERMGALRALLALDDAPPIVVMTANFADPRERALELGATDYLHKVDLVSGPALIEAVQGAVAPS